MTGTKPVPQKDQDASREFRPVSPPEISGQTAEIRDVPPPSRDAESPGYAPQEPQHIPSKIPEPGGKTKDKGK